jgi:N12 class adenine-specific DNA methylase
MAELKNLLVIETKKKFSSKELTKKLIDFDQSEKQNKKKIEDFLEDVSKNYDAIYIRKEGKNLSIIGGDLDVNKKRFFAIRKNVEELYQEDFENL